MVETMDEEELETEVSRQYPNRKMQKKKIFEKIFQGDSIQMMMEPYYSTLKTH